jgi:hypothetical protein
VKPRSRHKRQPILHSPAPTSLSIRPMARNAFHHKYLRIDAIPGRCAEGRDFDGSRPVNKASISCTFDEFGGIGAAHRPATMMATEPIS